MMAGKKGQTPRVEFSQVLFDRICKLIALGGSLRAICADADMPDRATFNGWRKHSEELQKQYDQACLDREDHYFEEIIHIADTEPDPRRAKVRMEAREWTLMRMNRKRFGDKVDIDAKVEGKLETITRRIVDPSQ